MHFISANRYERTQQRKTRRLQLVLPGTPALAATAILLQPYTCYTDFSKAPVEL